MALFIILIVFAGLITALLMMPIHLRINPDCERPNMNKTGFFRLNIDVKDVNSVSIILHLFYARFSWHPFQKEIDSIVKGQPSGKEITYWMQNLNRIKFLAHVAWQAVKKSRLNKLYLNLDTSNVILNANLYPFFEMMNERPGINLNINYTGEFALCLDFENSLWNFARAFIWNLLKRTFSIPKI
jgi:hypothetical protein